MIYELHITIDNDIRFIEKFKKDCLTLNVKPLVIDTETSSCNIQVMTSSCYNNNDYIQEVINLSNSLKSFGYDIKRCKVEIKPNIEKVNDNFIYFESHLRLKLDKNVEECKLLILKDFCKVMNFHYSKNLFKSDIDYNYQMITYRIDKPCYTSFIEHINIMKDFLTDKNIIFDKIEIEECILDTNINIDKNWLYEKQ
jgi:hypothetical protein